MNNFGSNFNTLQNNTISGLFVGQNFVALSEVDSTNNYLKSLASNSTPLPEGTVIMAENQYAGRGQQQNGWFAEPGKNLTFSILLRPSFLKITEQFDLVRAISLGVFDALAPLLGMPLKIKWPNDIYYGDNKLGGMLIENMIQGGQIKNAIAGIGLNINQEKFPEWVPNPISLKQILHADYHLRTLLSEICGHIEGWYLKLKAGKADDIRNVYLSRLYWLNEPHAFKAKDHTFAGTIKSVRYNGLLVVGDNSGNEREFSLKDVEFLNSNNRVR